MVVFLLALVGIILIVLNVYLINKDKDKDKSLFKESLTSSIENVDANVIEIGKIRIEIAESFLDLQTQMQKMKEEDSLLRHRIITLEVNNSIVALNKPVMLETRKIIENPIVVDSIYQGDSDKNNSEMNLKIHEVRKLLSQGVSIDEVSSKLNTPKGEVILIKNLYLK